MRLADFPAPGSRPSAASEPEAERPAHASARHSRLVRNSPTVTGQCSAARRSGFAGQRPAPRRLGYGVMQELLRSLDGVWRWPGWLL